MPVSNETKVRFEREQPCSLIERRMQLPKCVQDLLEAERVLAYIIGKANGRIENEHAAEYAAAFDLVEAEYAKIVEGTGVFNMIRAEHKAEKDDMWDKLSTNDESDFMDALTARVQKAPRLTADELWNHMTPGELQYKMEEFFQPEGE